jgi:hypothetical protein
VYGAAAEIASDLVRFVKRRHHGLRGCASESSGRPSALADEPETVLRKKLAAQRRNAFDKIFERNR